MKEFISVLDGAAAETISLPPNRLLFSTKVTLCPRMGCDPCGFHSRRPGAHNQNMTLVRRRLQLVLLSTKIGIDGATRFLRTRDDIDTRIAGNAWTNVVFPPIFQLAYPIWIGNQSAANRIDLICLLHTPPHFSNNRLVEEYSGISQLSRRLASSAAAESIAATKFCFAKAVSRSGFPQLQSTSQASMITVTESSDSCRLGCSKAAAIPKPGRPRTGVACLFTRFQPPTMFLKRTALSVANS